MNANLLHQTTVLVLNRHWQAIDAITPAEAFGHLAAGSARGLLIEGPHDMQALEWEEWRGLAPAEGQAAIGTTRGQVRVPTVIVLTRYDRVPMVRLSFGLTGLWERDEGRCQYTGRTLAPAEASIDHVLPRSRGGENNWHNCVLSDRRVNQRKGNRTPEEAGLRLLSVPRKPRPIPASARIRNHHQIEDWDHFLESRGGNRRPTLQS
ncbi:HNH endonuclease [Luteolibacter sp. LG18]|uniref:HNH endonuclease n=1 Tax=Luteolibacter sp. LG18 TaxID=2819286 RepID=UPI002B308542|nr:restriction endonuclease [Luteolibacter sp. LG18]